jgi:Family of unknown function (DUF5994)
MGVNDGPPRPMPAAPLDRGAATRPIVMPGEVVWTHCEHQVIDQGPGPRPGRSTESDRRSNTRRRLMATYAPSSRFALRPVFDQHLSDGAWWPESRQLSDQLGALFAFWPPERGRVDRVLHSTPDWEVRPGSVHVQGRMVKTGSFPRDDTHQVISSLLDRSRRSITVNPPDTPHREAKEIPDRVRDVAAVGASHHRTEPQFAWDNEGGHL